MCLTPPLMPDKVAAHYAETLSPEDGLKNDLNDSCDHNRFKVLQKHIRFEVLNIMVQEYADQGADLKYFILYHHHDNDQLSQRDITALLKTVVSKLDERKKRRLIKEAVDEIACRLMRIAIIQNRVKVVRTLQGEKPLSQKEKRAILEKALGDDPEEKFLKRLESFDQKTIANFAAVFGLHMRNGEEKGKGKACRKKLARRRREANKKMWSDSETSRALCLAMKEAWVNRKNNDEG